MEDDPWLVIIEPCSIDAAVSCLRIHARVFSMERISSTHDFAGTRADFAMAATQTFLQRWIWDNEKAIKFQRKLLKQPQWSILGDFVICTLSYTLPSTRTFEAEIPLLGKAWWIDFAHQLSTNNEWNTLITTFLKQRHRQKIHFTIEETLIIKPCLKYEVSSTVRMTKNAAS
ncbi:hypothetical protein Ocin01_14671 [Orchesella cincta]|uniref:Uncharacterized protein n=1 Tax=Orchesella cincta TaxID=48709 RepID=A0A1D2MGB9_ORCCI|nr:hypothetical protein Ocin01_14671 [Orchesella cincta]